MTFIAMNRFRIHHGFEEGFERMWRERESHARRPKVRDALARATRYRPGFTSLNPVDLIHG